MAKTVKEILIAGIKAAGGDGMCCDGCGCDIDDLAPYECNPLYCVIAKRHFLDMTSELCKYCEEYCNGGCYQPIKETDPYPPSVVRWRSMEEKPTPEMMHTPGMYVGSGPKLNCQVYPVIAYNGCECKPCFYWETSARNVSNELTAWAFVPAPEVAWILKRDA